MVTYPVDWTEKSIGELFDVSAGGDVKKEYFSEIRTSSHPFEIFSNGLDNRGLYGYTSMPLYGGNALTVTARGTIGYAFYRQAPFDAIIRLLVLVPHNENVNPRFYEYYINRFVHFNYEGSGVPQLTAPKIKEKCVPFPSKDEQSAIADTLITFDTHIDNLNVLIEKKKAIRDGALEELMSGRTRLDGFSGEWDEVDFNEVITPKARIGWQGLKKDEYLYAGYSYLIGGTDFLDGTVCFDNISYVSKERYEMDENIQVFEDDVLVTKDGTIGKVAIVPAISKPATLNSGVFVFRTNERLQPRFLYRVLTSSIFRNFISLSSAGSTIKHLFQKTLKDFHFYIPNDVREQTAIAKILDSIDNEIHDLEVERDKMLQIKEGAMDDLLTGRVRLPM